MTKKKRRESPPFRLTRQPRQLQDDAVTRRLLEAAGADADALIGRKGIFDVWIEVDLEPPWRAAYRLALYGRSYVISEVRVFPADTHSGREAGCWRADVLGLAARALDGKTGFPKIGRGLTAAVLRQVPFDVQRYARAIATELRKSPLSSFPLTVEQHVSTEAAERALRRHTSEHQGQRRARPDRWPDERYAKIAAAYVECVEANSRSPVADVARRFRSLSRAQVRDAIHTARERGILEKTERQGQAGGLLTAYGASLLKKKRR